MRKNTKLTSETPAPANSAKTEPTAVSARSAKSEPKPVVVARPQKKTRAPVEISAARKALDLAAKPAAEIVPCQPATKFTFFAPDAGKVSLCGDFNAWSTGAAPMKRQDNGVWETALVLKPGRYQYKFFVDGQWLSDPNASETEPNTFGTLNSVIQIQS
jgi:1,4-alpha-glucan branching enzyme